MKADSVREFCAGHDSFLRVEVGDTNNGDLPIFFWVREGAFDFHARLLFRKKTWPEEGEEVSGIGVYVEGEKHRAALVKALRFTADAVEERIDDNS